MRTEEAIDLLDNLIGMVEDNYNSDYDKALKMAIKSLEQTMWIPASEGSPEIGQYVLCSLINAKDVKYRIIICEYKQEIWWSYVMAWMPLPELYKEYKK